MYIRRLDDLVFKKGDVVWLDTDEDFAADFQAQGTMAKEDLIERVNKWLDITDPIGKNHINEGVVVRIENRIKFTAFKQKGWYFKVLSGIAQEKMDDKYFEMGDDLLSEI